MTTRTTRICIVTPNYISGSPRTVKEADALTRVGYDVRVVFSQGNIEQYRQHDTALLSSRKWRHHSFGWSSARAAERWLYHFSRFRHALARRLPLPIGRLHPVAEMAQGRVFPELARAAALERADLYIGHYPDGLAAAAFAAGCWQTGHAYDFEDFHVGEGTDLKGRHRVEIIEKRFLPQCRYISAASALMSSALANHYAISDPVTIHNVFPWGDRSTLDGEIRDRRGDALSIYWYSQTIGLDRGIQDAIRALGLVDAPIQLHLRGALTESVREELQSLARECGITDRIYFHERIPPTELLSRAVEHDIGLAVEQPVDSNKKLTVSNKLFFYLLAGLCVVATDVPGQAQIMKTIPDAGHLYPVGNFQALAELFKRLVDNPELLRRKKEAALAAARDRWNWEIESQKLVDAVGAALGDRPSIRSIN